MLPENERERKQHNLLWLCLRQFVHLCRLCLVQSASEQVGTYLACALELWSGLCSLESDEGGARWCTLPGCHSEEEQTVPNHKAVPLCQEVLLLPDYPA